MSDLLSELLTDSDPKSANYQKAEACTKLYAAAVNAACLLGRPLSSIRVEFWSPSRQVGHTYHSSVLFYDGTTWRLEKRLAWVSAYCEAYGFLLFDEIEVEGEDGLSLPEGATKIREQPLYRLDAAKAYQEYDYYRGARRAWFEVSILYPKPEEPPQRKTRKKKGQPK